MFRLKNLEVEGKIWGNDSFSAFKSRGARANDLWELQCLAFVKDVFKGVRSSEMSSIDASREVLFLNVQLHLVKVFLIFI